MKKFFILFLFIITFECVCFADNNVFSAETGVVKSINYVDIEENKISEDEPVKQIVTVEILTGDFKGTQRIIDNMLTGNPAYDIPLNKGDKVILHIEPNGEKVSGPDDLNYYIADIKRDTQIWLFAGLFALLLIIIGKKKGLRSIVSIIATVGLIFFLTVPAVLSGVSPILSAIITGILSTIITIYLVGGFNSKSTSAIAGTSTSLIFAGFMSVCAIYLANLTGFAGEENMFLYSARPDLDFTGLLSASMIIASLGALMDTAVSISSTINEIHETDKTLNTAQLFKSGMNVGKDIIGTMSNTLILVYLGSSLPLVLLSSNIDLYKFFNLNQVATEILSALIGSIAILACVPITAIISSVLIKKYSKKTKFNMEQIDINEN
ncbi:YibE/F family protein [bacterium]|nr:YibE/F family protein [bacterium]